MKLGDLLKFDTSIKLIHNEKWPEDILAISALDSIVPQSLIFIKNGKFLQKFLSNFDLAVKSMVGVIVEEKFYFLMEASLKEQLKQLAWGATTKSVALSITYLSKPFYDLKFKDLNHQVDGRQLGTADIHPSARISQGVFIGENVRIGENVVVLPGSVIMPMVEVGDGTIIFPQVTIYPYTQIGKNCRIHSGTVIGADGFGYTFDQGVHKKIWHYGGVIIKDDVEIGSNCSVDMGTFSPTVIGEGTRIDNQVQVAHNCKIGKGCVLCGQSGLAGSATLEDFVVLGGRAAVGPDAHLGMGTQVAGGGMVNEGAVWPSGSKLGGHPARDVKEWMKGFAYLRKVSLQENDKTIKEN